MINELQICKDKIEEDNGCVDMQQDCEKKRNADIYTYILLYQLINYQVHQVSLYYNFYLILDTIVCSPSVNKKRQTKIKFSYIFLLGLIVP
jgi:hypothetical protein